MEWISIEDRLPNTKGVILAINWRGKENCPHSFRYEMQSVEDLRVFVTHWQTLPKPPNQ